MNAKNLRIFSIGFAALAIVLVTLGQVFPDKAVLFTSLIAVPAAWALCYLVIWYKKKPVNDN